MLSLEKLALFHKEQKALICEVLSLIKEENQALELELVGQEEIERGPLHEQFAIFLLRPSRDHSNARTEVAKLGNLRQLPIA